MHGVLPRLSGNSRAQAAYRACAIAAETERIARYTSNSSVQIIEQQVLRKFRAYYRAV